MQTSSSQLTLTAALEIAIVIVGMYAALSWVISAVHERIADVLSLRGEKLYQGVLNLVCGHDGLAEKIFQHPLIVAGSDDRTKSWNPIVIIGNALSLVHPDGTGDPVAGKKYRPSYVDARTFSMAFWDKLGELPPPATAASPPEPITSPPEPITSPPAPPADVASTLAGALKIPPQTIASLQGALAGIEQTHKPLYATCTALLTAAGDDYEKLLRVTDGWFNGQMDRVSGWYKRQTGWVIAALALILVSFAGIDSLEIGKKLYANPDTRAALADQFSNAVSGKDKVCNDKASTTKDADEKKHILVACAADKAASNISYADWVHPTPYVWDNWLHHAPGMAVTTAALAFGGPVWFGLLLKLVNVRAAGRKPQRKDAPPT